MIVTLSLPPALLEMLDAEAARRGLSRSKTATRILAGVLEPSSLGPSTPAETVPAERSRGKGPARGLGAKRPKGSAEGPTRIKSKWAFDPMAKLRSKGG